MFTNGRVWRRGVIIPSQNKAITELFGHFSSCFVCSIQDISEAIRKVRVSLTSSDQNIERNGDFNIENVLFIFDLISCIHFYGKSVYCVCVYLNKNAFLQYPDHLTLHCAVELRTLQHVESNSGWPISIHVHRRQEKTKFDFLSPHISFADIHLFHRC